MADYDCKLCKDYNTEVNCYDCEDGSKFKKINNFEKIRNMSIEQLANLISGIDHYCNDGQLIVTIGDYSLNDRVGDILEWLQSEAE